MQHQAAAIACVLEDENDETNSTAIVPLYNVVQKESVNDVAINPELSAEQINKVKSLLKEYSDKVTHPFRKCRFRLISTKFGTLMTFEPLDRSDR